MTSSSASPSARLHRIPRRPHAWVWLLALSQLLVAAVWWRYGWRVGLPLMVASHAPFWWGTLWPYSRMFGPVLKRLQTAEKQVWLTIDDGPSDDTLAVLDDVPSLDSPAILVLAARYGATRLLDNAVLGDVWGN